MSNIEEKIIVNVPVKVIWEAWADRYLQAGLEIGNQGHVVSEKKGIKFKILDFKENESLTIVWHSFLIKLVFHHKVEVKDVGSLITCKVRLKGFFSFIVKPLIAGKIRKYLQLSLQRFSKDLSGI